MKPQLCGQPFGHIAPFSAGRGFLEPNNVRAQSTQLLRHPLQAAVQVLGVPGETREDPAVEQIKGYAFQGESRRCHDRGTCYCGKKGKHNEAGAE